MVCTGSSQESLGGFTESVGKISLRYFRRPNMTEHVGTVSVGPEVDAGEVIQ